MLSSKATLVVNILSVLLFLAIIAMQMSEIYRYTGSYFGFFQ